MADVTSAPATTAPNNEQSFVQRELTGASFLTLEHIGHLLLVLSVPALVAAALNMAIDFWMKSSGSGPGNLDLMSLMMMSGGSMHVMMAVSIAAALIVLTPLLVVLGRRTRAEWQKRPGYTSRLAYKVPVYTALGLAAAGAVMLKITLLSVIIESLVLIGVEGTDFGAMYLHQFLPSFISYIAALATTWYLFKLAKGREKGKMFDMAVAALAAVLVVVVLVAATMAAHDKSKVQDLPAYPTTPTPSTQMPSDLWDDAPAGGYEFDY